MGRDFWRCTINSSSDKNEELNNYELEATYIIDFF